MYECITGEVPFKRDSPLAICYAHVHEKPLAPIQINESVSERVSLFVMKMLEKDSAKRPADFKTIISAMAAQAENRGREHSRANDDSDKSPNRDEGTDRHAHSSTTAPSKATGTAKAPDWAKYGVIGSLIWFWFAWSNNQAMSTVLALVVAALFVLYRSEKARRIFFETAIYLVLFGVVWILTLWWGAR